MLQQQPFNDNKKFFTSRNRPVCAFTAFATFYESAYPDNKFTYRGDRFTNDPEAMLVKLVECVTKPARFQSIKTVVIYDNRKGQEISADNWPENIVLKWNQGRLECNRSKEYPQLKNILNRIK
jgi:hypothetical protein